MSLADSPLGEDALRDPHPLHRALRDERRASPPTKCAESLRCRFGSGLPNVAR